LKPVIAGPLSGLHVVELSHMVMGPSCGLVLGDLGADVVKIEPPGGDKTRRLTGSGAGFFASFNRNKRSVGVDLKTADGLDLLHRLIAKSDVLIENFRPGIFAAHGLDYGTLSRRYPRLIYCSLKGFLSGPYEDRVALDEVVQMMGGLAYMTGPPGRPLRAGTSINDIMGGVFGAVGVLAALQELKRTGKGQLVRSALFENAAFLVSQHIAQQAVTGEPVAPMPARLAAWGIYDVFDAADGQFFLGVVTGKQWRAFCKEFDLTELDTEDMSENAQRVAARPQILPLLERVFRSMTCKEAMGRCERIGLPFAPIAKPEDLTTDPHLNAGQGMLDVSLGDGRRARIPGLPVELNDQRLPVWRDVPDAGEHSISVARELGYDESDIQRMLASGSLIAADEARSESLEVS
jgi:crotonobetainyl-CoA:carnitine CoA-transferase CaiB-like acyl-CoA transferase